MKLSFLIISTVILSVLNGNASTLKAEPNVATTREAITTKHFVKVYDWSVKTISGKSSGTALNLEDAKEMIALFSQNESILEKSITSYYVLQVEANNTKNRVYYWEVNSTYAKAKGFSSSESDAREMICLVSKGDIITYKIITSKKRK